MNRLVALTVRSSEITCGTLFRATAGTACELERSIREQRGSRLGESEC